MRSDDLRPGQRVIMTFLPRCGDCRACRTDGLVPCAAGSAPTTRATMMDGGSRLRRGDQVVHHHLGVSGFATHAVVDRRSVVPVDDDVPADVAAVMGCAVLTGGGALLNVGRPRAGDTVVVVGLGGVGMAALLTALGEPDVEVVAVDPVAAKRDRALILGAGRALAPDEARGVGSRRPTSSSRRPAAPGPSRPPSRSPGPGAGW